MKVFVAEFVCGGGLARQATNEIPASLRREGAAMLAAIVADMSQIAETVVPLDARFETALGRLVTSAPTVKMFRIEPDKSIWSQWVDAARGCDSAIVVAPERDGMLSQAVAMLRAGGVDVIAGSGDFLRAASDKLQTAKVLLAAGIAHPRYVATSDMRYESEVATSSRFVMKPRDGCGTQHIQTFNDYLAALAELTDDKILQPWVDGRAISISLIANGSGQTFLPAVSQELSSGTCEYTGGIGPLDEDIQRRATLLAARVIAAMPPTARGFVGLDLLIGERPSEDCVIEINPRLTTSYVGLRRMIQGNLAARLVELESGPIVCQATVESVRWDCDGRVWVDDQVVDYA
jgi:tyramine---L-glutamate ligase